MDNITRITIFDKPYSREKQAEGLAVSWAVTSAKCLLCPHRPICANDDHFVFPPDAACMMRKAEILQQWEKGGAS